MSKLESLLGDPPPGTMVTFDQVEVPLALHLAGAPINVTRTIFLSSCLLGTVAGLIAALGGLSVGLSLLIAALPPGWLFVLFVFLLPPGVHRKGRVSPRSLVVGDRSFLLVELESVCLTPLPDSGWSLQVRTRREGVFEWMVADARVARWFVEVASAFREDGQRVTPPVALERLRQRATCIPGKTFPDRSGG